MPELPEVETTRRGIEPYLRGHRIQHVFIRERRLRWPIMEGLEAKLLGFDIHAVRRRAKYLLIDLEHGSLIIHLGMSGSLRLVESQSPLLKHDHVELGLDSRLALRLHDPRRFGAMLWSEHPAGQHPLLAKLGPEPLAPGFDGDDLFQILHHRRQAIKSAIMDQRVVVGVGNIYANEALFLAGIDPRRACCTLSKSEFDHLAKSIQDVLRQAVEQGGTTLRDFLNPQGKPGYFQQTLYVYGRNQQPCRRCDSTLEQTIIGQRATFYCPHCQR